MDIRACVSNRASAIFSWRPSPSQSSPHFIRRWSWVDSVSYILPLHMTECHHFLREIRHWALEVLAVINFQQGSESIAFPKVSGGKGRELQEFPTEAILFRHHKGYYSENLFDCPHFSSSGNTFLFLFTPEIYLSYHQQFGSAADNCPKLGHSQTLRTGKLSHRLAGPVG